MGTKQRATERLGWRRAGACGACAWLSLLIAACGCAGSGTSPGAVAVPQGVAGEASASETAAGAVPEGTRVAGEEVGPDATSSPAEEGTIAGDGVGERDWRAELETSLSALRDAGSREALESVLSSLAALLRDEAARIDTMELLQIERAVNAEVVTWIQRQGLSGLRAAGESCVATSECGVGRCAGAGCTPGQWRCVEPPGPGDPHTTDMRTACLCRGGTYVGSSTGLRGQRVRHRGQPCPEETPRPVRPR